MPLTPCPDCGREVSTAAPGCIHCGRPMAAPAAPLARPAPAVPREPEAEKPMWGIVTALVLGVMGIIQAMDRPEPPSEAMRNVSFVVSTLHMTGNAALIIFALMSLAGQRAAHRAVRALSVGMIILICATMLLAWRVVVGLNAGDPQPLSPGLLMGAAAVTALFQAAQWLLMLFLFRRSRYP
jgi:hypothetical protein